jgi:hypothetical protein
MRIDMDPIFVRRRRAFAALPVAIGLAAVLSFCAEGPNTDEVLECTIDSLTPDSNFGEAIYAVQACDTEGVVTNSVIAANLADRALDSFRN